MHAAEHYGVEALGITLSEPQAELANERIRAAGLEGRCRVDVCDYRDLDAPEAFDKVASICMFEAVGEGLLPDFFARASAFMRPGGVFLNQGVARNYHFERTARRGPSFMERYVFPDGGVVPISTALQAAERAGLEVRDVESLREHYELTLRHWVARLDERRDDAIRATDEQTYRVWRLYMSGSAYGMKTGRLNVYQALLAKSDGGASGLPLTREDWYARTIRV
jgi:cyclopropane-fatty-acyl-phospholipid synthase